MRLTQYVVAATILSDLSFSHEDRIGSKRLRAESSGGVQREIKSPEVAADDEPENNFWIRALQTSMKAPPVVPPTFPPVVPPTFPPVVPPTFPPVVPPTFPPVVPPTFPPVVPPTFRPVEAPSASPSMIPSFPCPEDPTTRAALLTQIAVEVSGPVALTPGTPQNNALNWLINQDNYFACPSNPKTVQRYVMAVFYYSTQGDMWFQCSAPDNLDDEAAIEAANAACNVNTTSIPGGPTGPFGIDTVSDTDAWLTPVNECYWGGLVCNRDNFCLDRIEFERNNVGGTLPTEISNLTSLRFYILEEGNVTGPIPSEYGALDQLLVFDANFNGLTGSLPDPLYDWTELRQLDLNDNFLTGSISTLIGELSRLVFIQLNNNLFTGTIPTELGLASNLNIASFDQNTFVGSMPTEVCALDEIRILITDCGGDNPEVECSCCTSCNQTDAPVANR